METRATYGDAAEIRRECLMPFADGWQQPTPNEIRAVLKLAGLTGSEASKLLGVSDGRTVRRWTGGDAPIPFSAWAILCDTASLGTIWRRPHSVILEEQDGSLSTARERPIDLDVPRPDGTTEYRRVMEYNLDDGRVAREQLSGEILDDQGNSLNILDRSQRHQNP